MVKITECLYGCLVTNEYMGKRSSEGEAVYDMTVGADYDDYQRISSAVGSSGFAGLSRIDRQRGVCSDSDSGRIDLDYSMRSFSYMPAKGRTPSLFKCNAMRPSLRDRELRGYKELLDGLMFDSLPDGFYAVDLMGIGFTSDIPLLPDAERIVEAEPQGLPQRDFSAIASPPLTTNDLIGMDAEAVVGILCGLMRAIRERRTLYLVYEPGDMADIERMIRCSLKLLPSGLANSISFITCFGESSSAGGYNICGIPTADKGVIEGLSDGIVFRPMSDTPDLSVSDFGMLKGIIEGGDAATWLELIAHSTGIIDTLEDLEAIVPLVAGFKGPTAVEPEAALSAARTKIDAVAERYGLLVRLFGDPFARLKVRDGVRAAILASASVQETRYREMVIDPLRRLFDNPPEGLTDGDRGALTGLLIESFIGLEGMDRSGAFGRVTEDQDVIEAWIRKNSEEFNGWLEAYNRALLGFLREYSDADGYGEILPDLGLRLLRTLFETGCRTYSLLDGLVSLILDKADLLETIIDMSFSVQDVDPRDRYNCAIRYIEERYRANSGNADYCRDLIRTYVRCVNKHGAVKELIMHASTRYRVHSSDFSDLLMRTMLETYVPPMADGTLAELCQRFDLISAFVGPAAQVRTTEFYYGYFLRDVVPNYKDVLQGVRSPEMIPLLLEKCRVMAESFGDAKLAGSDIPNREDFVEQLNLLLERHKAIEAQRATENELRDFRIDFVVHEFRLLDQKTVGSLFREYSIEPIEVIPENRVSEKASVKVFLSGDADPEVKRRFCMRVTNERKKVKAAYVVSSIAMRIALSLVFAFAMATIVFAAGYFINGYLSDGYHASMYVFAAVLTFLVSLFLYYDSWRVKGTHNVLLRAASQAIILIVVAIALYVGTQWVLMDMLR